MSKKITLIFIGNRLFKAAYAQDDLSRVKRGDEFVLELKKPRNIRFHRLFFAMLNTVHANLPEPIAEYLPTLEAVLDDIKVGTGHVERRFSPTTGEAYLKPKSISFASMNQVEFEEFYNRALNFCIANYFQGDEHMQEVLALHF